MPSISLNELAHYNCGTLLYKTFDLEDYSSARDYRAAVSEWLESIPRPYTELNKDGTPEESCEEYCIGDADDVDDIFVGDYEFDAETYYQWVELDTYEKIAFEYLVEEHGMGNKEAFDNVDNLSVIAGETPQSYAMSLISDTYTIPSFLEYYIDYDAFARDLESDGDIAYYDKHKVTITGLTAM